MSSRASPYPNLDEWWTTTEVADFTDRHRDYIKQLCTYGGLHCERKGNIFLIHSDEIARYQKEGPLETIARPVYKPKKKSKRKS